MKGTIFVVILAIISSLKLSAKGLEFIKELEGLQLEAVKNERGKWVVGYGTNDAHSSVTGKRIKEGVKVDAKTAEKWLKQVINKKYAPKVNKHNNKYKWTQNEFDALISFAYSEGNIEELTSNGKRNKELIAKKLLEYNKINGKVNEKLKKRRESEQKLFLTKQ